MIYPLSFLALVAVAVAGDSKSCSADTPLSCHNNTAVADTCCFMATGQLLQTQFWDTAPATGPKGINH
jgi:ribonuclease T2